MRRKASGSTSWRTAGEPLAGMVSRVRLDSSFRDKRGRYGFDMKVEDVWLSDVQFDANKGANGDVLLAVTLDDHDLIDCRVVEKGSVRRYRELLVPATVINARGKVRLVSADGRNCFTALEPRAHPLRCAAGRGSGAHRSSDVSSIGVASWMFIPSLNHGSAFSDSRY